MTHQSTLTQLISQHCSDGVEFLPLGEIATIGTGSHNTQDAIEDGKYIFYARGKDPLRLNSFDFDETAIITAGDGAGVGKVFHWAEGQYSLHQRAYRIVPHKNTNVRYIYYYILANFYTYIMKSSVSSSVTSLRMPMFQKFQIPIPPLPVQEEIVRILDTFTQLEAELEAELEARKKQYEYYRDEILSFGDDDVEWKELKEIANFSQGIQIDVEKQLPNMQEGFVRFLRIVDFVKDSEPPRYIENPGTRYVKKEGDLVMIRYGASAAGKVFLEYEGAIANNMFQIKLKTEEVSTNFLHCYLSQTKIYNHLNSNGGASTMPAITFGQIGSVKIPVPQKNGKPNLEKQQEIVAILHKFDTIVNDISIGLPAEIAARRQQYERYRDKLLTFTQK